MRIASGEISRNFIGARCFVERNMWSYVRQVPNHENKAREVVAMRTSAQSSH